MSGASCIGGGRAAINSAAAGQHRQLFRCGPLTIFLPCVSLRAINKIDSYLELRRTSLIDGGVAQLWRILEQLDAKLP
jgi:hypothetical protein